VPERCNNIQSDERATDLCGDMGSSQQSHSPSDEDDDDEDDAEHDAND